MWDMASRGIRGTRTRYLRPNAIARLRSAPKRKPGDGGGVASIHTVGLREEAPVFLPLSDLEGHMLVSGVIDGFRRLVDGRVEAFSLPGVGQVSPNKLLRDRDGGLWVSTRSQGLLHIHQGRTDGFTSADGLSGDSASKLFEDREGNIWATTTDGLDRFRDFTVSTVSVKQGLSSAAVSSVLPGRDGSVWIGASDGLDRWSNGQITIYRKPGTVALRRPGMPTAAREIAADGLPANSIASLFQDEGRRIWVATPAGVASFEDGGFTPAVSGRGMIVHSMTGESAGNLWINEQGLGLLHLLDGKLVETVPWERLGRKDVATVLVSDRAQGGLWLGFFQGGLAYFKDGQIRASYATADGLGAGTVNALRFHPDGSLWAATEGGLSRLKDGRIATLTSGNGLPCDAVQWEMEDDLQSVWLNLPCGLVQVARPDLEAWAADPRHAVKATVFDHADGVKLGATPGFFTPHAAKSADGRLWFAVHGGVSVIDPRHLGANPIPPPVHIEQITADRTAQWQNLWSEASPSRPLPPLVRELQIDYTALSLVAPEKIRFRYKLEGHDSDWHDAGNRRQAFYNDLRPRKYRFRVQASNNSGLWNEAGASLDFAIAPMYYQTGWFEALCVAAILAVVGGLFRLRVLYLARQFNMRLEERVNERTRIARELHDTLLQSFQGVLMMFSVVADQLPDHPEEARQALVKVIGQARQAVIEGRNAVQGLRASTVVTNDLARAISSLGEELATGQTGARRPELHVLVEGATRDLAPLVRDDVHRIACEAVRNAFLHAQAGRIEVEIGYERQRLRLLVRDDGKGIDEKVLAEGGRPGHFGLAGMRERAQLVGGKLAVFTRPDSGTEVELTIPASIAYLKTAR